MNLERTSTYPKVYRNFSVENEEFYIADLTEDKTEEALNILVEYVIPEENFCKAIAIHKKPNAVKVMCENYCKLFKLRTSLACFKKETGELVGLNILGLKFRGEKAEPVEDPDMKILRESSAFTIQQFDIFKHFPVDRYLHAYGLGVIREYRGKGIAVELLKARIPLMKSINCSLTATIFSTLSSQKSAIKAGYREVFAFSYEETQTKFPHFDFSTATGTHWKAFVFEV